MKHYITCEMTDSVAISICGAHIPISDGAQKGEMIDCSDCDHLLSAVFAEIEPVEGHAWMMKP